MLAFSSCWKQGLLFIAVRGLLIMAASLVVEQGSRHMDSASMYVSLVAQRHVESSQTRDQTPVPCVGKWVLIHCTCHPGKSKERCIPEFISQSQA